MRILLASTVHNCLSQSVQLELAALGHELAVTVVTNEKSIVGAVDQFRPELIIAPMLKSRIPESVWSQYPCLIVHPGIKGDRGPSSLDWAITEGESRWGVTLLQANQDMDAGDIWASQEFPLRQAASKASIYRHEVTRAALACIRQAVDAVERGQLRAEPLDYQRPDVLGRLRPVMRQADRSIDWSASTDRVLARLQAADSQPGVFERINGAGVYLFGPVRGPQVNAAPGSWLACRDGALCRATGDGSVWIRQARVLPPHGHGIKLPAGDALADVLDLSPVADFAKPVPGDDWREISYHESDGVGYLNFDFYNGAMSTSQCRRLTRAFKRATRRDARVLVLSGGLDFWSNGIHLNNIEAAELPGAESWANINAIDDLVQEIIGQTDRIVISAIHGNAGAGGVTMALAADDVWVRRGAVLNPHYRGMGELFGSEYWTYLMPRRVGDEVALSLWSDCQPIDTAAALATGLIDR
ncbi:MAG: enoyl-CoA hydratase-related protein, partial [Wenzhouxiangellaceae bacterium]